MITPNGKDNPPFPLPRAQTSSLAPLSHSPFPAMPRGIICCQDVSILPTCHNSQLTSHNVRLTSHISQITTHNSQSGSTVHRDQLQYIHHDSLYAYPTLLYGTSRTKRDGLNVKSRASQSVVWQSHARRTEQGKQKQGEQTSALAKASDPAGLSLPELPRNHASLHFPTSPIATLISTPKCI